MQDTNQQQDDNQQPNDAVVPTQPISAGSAEAPASTPVQEAPAQNVEYGYESIKNIENAPRPAESAERKEAPKPQHTSQPQTSQPKPKKAVKAPVNKAKMPSFFGYKIPPQIANNPTLILNRKGKGDSAEARTWIYMLLDRLMKKQGTSNPA